MKVSNIALGIVGVAVAYLLYKDYKKAKCPCKAAAAASTAPATSTPTSTPTPAASTGAVMGANGRKDGF